MEEEEEGEKVEEGEEVEVEVLEQRLLPYQKQFHLQVLNVFEFSFSSDSHFFIILSYS